MWALASSLPAAELPPCEARLLKRKKTVTWADGELELPLAQSPSSAEKAAGAGSGGGSGSALGSKDVSDDPVVVLPCDGLFDSLSLELLEQQGAQQLQAASTQLAVVGLLACGAWACLLAVARLLPGWPARLALLLNPAFSSARRRRHCAPAALPLHQRIASHSRHCACMP